PPAVSASASSIPSAFKRFVICLATRKPNRLTTPAVDVRQLDRFGANSDDAVSTVDGSAFRSVRHVSSRVAQYRDLLPVPLQRPDELQRNRRHWRWRRGGRRHGADRAPPPAR